jgi:zeaxanthin glucosyltransferase
MLQGSSSHKRSRGKVHFGFLANASNTHVSSMAAVGAALRARGHRVTFFQVPDFEGAVCKHGLEYCVVGEDRYPIGSMKRLDERLGRTTGINGLRYSIERAVHQSAVFLEVVPQKIRELGVDFLVVDDVELYGFTVAERLSLPYVTLSMALPAVIDDSIPPYFTNWSYRADAVGRFRNRLGYRYYLRLTAPLVELVDRYRLQWRLPARSSRESRRARLASISQLPQCFDFPRVALSRFHYSAPFGLRLPRPQLDFPWHRLGKRPLVYAAFGTVMSQPRALELIAEASCSLGCETVISLGGGTLKPEAFDHLPQSQVVVVRNAPQLELIKRAAVVVTHGGLNTVLESLAFGVPLLVVPFVNDQPGVASRVQRSGVGEVISPRNLSLFRARRELDRILSHRSYRTKSESLRSEIDMIDGPSRAADVIEECAGVSRVACVR